MEAQQVRVQLSTQAQNKGTVGAGKTQGIEGKVCLTGTTRVGFLEGKAFGLTLDQGHRWFKLEGPCCLGLLRAHMLGVCVVDDQ